LGLADFVISGAGRRSSGVGDGSSCWWRGGRGGAGGSRAAVPGSRGHHHHDGEAGGRQVKIGRSLVLEESIVWMYRSLYNGLSAGLQRQMCFASVRLGLYDTTKAFYQQILDSGTRKLMYLLAYTLMTEETHFFNY